MTVLPAPTVVAEHVRVGSRPKVRAATLLLATLLALVWLASLSRNLFAPFGNDHCILQFITDRVMAGQRMYGDVMEHNAPGIIAIHWASTVLFGRSPMDLRMFEACWQLATLIALVTLAGRDGGRWQAGWLAAMLWVLAFYGYGHTNTAEREGFCVLPLLLAVHAMTPGRSKRWRFGLGVVGHFVAGVLGLFVFAIKPPLGMCYGVLWLSALGDGWRRRSEGVAAWANLGGLTAGFLSSAAVGAVLLMRLDWWESYLPVFYPAGYAQGPWKIRLVLPYLGIGALILGSVSYWVIRRAPDGAPPREHHLRKWEVIRCTFAGTLVLGLLLTIVYWPQWGKLFLRIAGLALPAVGSVLLWGWWKSSPIRRSYVLLAAASLGAVFLQGRFTPYRFAPFLAFFACLAAGEIVDRFRSFNADSRGGRIWAMVCVGGVIHLGLAHWWPQMIMYSRQPRVLAGTTLNDHYDRVVHASKDVVPYATSVRVSEHVRSLTEPDEPIALLFTEPRIYYLCERPPVHRMILTRPFYRYLYGEFFETIDQRRPPVVLARVPASCGPGEALSTVESAIFRETESYFGPCAGSLRQGYRLAELIGQVALLRPVSDAEM